MDVGDPLTEAVCWNAAWRMVTAGSAADALAAADFAGLVIRRLRGSVSLPDPVAGEQNRATCRALRPDAAAKLQAWTAALAAEADWRLAVASASGIWVPGQGELLGRSWLAEYRDRYFAEALPALDGRGGWGSG